VERLVWLPALTLGYIFTLSGTGLDFGLAIASVPGARIFYDVFGADEFKNADSWGEGFEKLAGEQDEASGERRDILVAIPIILYAVTLVWALIRLREFFRHSDIVLVGLAGIYWGVASIVVANIVATSTIERPTRGR